MSSLVRSCMELRNIFLRGWGTLKTAAVYHARLRTAHFVVQRIACSPLIAAALTYHAEVRCSTAVGQGTILRHVGAAAGKEVQAIPCGTFLYRGCNQTKGNPKTVGFWRRFCVLLPPRAKGCRAGARNIPAEGKHAGRGCSPQSKNEKRALRTPAPAGCATEAARNDPRPGRGIPFLHLTTKAQKIATQGQLFPPRVIVFRQAASKCALTGCLLSAFVCVILGNDSTNLNFQISLCK